MDCSRDRVHDPFDEDIQNGPFGVTSICTSSINLNEDIDLGNSLTLTGQKYFIGKLDEDPLIKNYENQIPVRLIRSYNLLNDFAPKTGYRYDGLYIVTKFWIGINSDSVKYYKFALLRLSDQEPSLWINPVPLAISNCTSTLHSTSVSLRNYLKNSAPNLYEFKKYSHGAESIIQKEKHENSFGFSQSQNIENKKVNEKKIKNITKSAIVTRHVFKKLNTEYTSNVPCISTISKKSLSHIENKGSKTHNTNISIRTGLYNSSHNTRNDNKKNTSSPFCRTTKSLNIHKTNQHIENWNLSNKDKNKNFDGKTQTIATNEFSKRINYISFNSVKPDSIKIKFAKSTNTKMNNDTNNTNANSYHRFECNVTSKEISNDFKDLCNNTINSPDTTNMLNITNCMYKNEISAYKMMSKELQELKSLDSLDSLTPDKILYLINNKNHPLSKLLMGNMIGITSEQSIALQTGNTMTIKSEIKDKIGTQKNNKEEIKGKTKFEIISDDLSESRYYKFRRRRKLSRRVKNKSEMIKYNKLHGEKFEKESIQSSDILQYSRKNKGNTDICKDLKNKNMDCLSDSKKYIKKNAENSIKTRMHLQTVRTIDSSIKKHINKKQRREITNLLIDAKIGPKIRGPRYRRLRCINNAYTKQSYDHFDGTIYTLNKCKVNTKRSTIQSRNKLTKITRCKRVKTNETRNIKRSDTLNVKHQKNKNLNVSRKVNKNYDTKKTIIHNNNKINENNIDNINNKKSEHIEKNIKIIESKDITTIKNRKRKLIDTIHRDSKCNKTDEKLLRNCYEKRISKSYKTDAVTQCSLLKEPLKNLKSNNILQNDVHNEQYTFIKIEYGDFKDTKYEMNETMKSDASNNYSISRPDKKFVSCTDLYNLQHPVDANISLKNNILNVRGQNKCSLERVSAFVPVNIPDNDTKIARLRSIGFKPINFSNNVEDSNQNKKDKVLKQNVTEKYNKYTNEENDVVVYMDDELQYQDIEDEDKNSLSIREKISDSKIYTERLNKVNLEKESCNSLLEQDIESPWHGWKKIVTNKDSYWIGW